MGEKMIKHNDENIKQYFYLSKSVAESYSNSLIKIIAMPKNRRHVSSILISYSQFTNDYKGPQKFTVKWDQWDSLLVGSCGLENILSAGRITRCASGNFRQQLTHLKKEKKFTIYKRNIYITGMGRCKWNIAEEQR